MVGQLLHLWLKITTLMVGITFSWNSYNLLVDITFMVVNLTVVTFMGYTLALIQSSVFVVEMLW